MALVFLDHAQQTGTANTTVSFSLTGLVTGFEPFAGIGNGNTTYYAAVDIVGNWESGLGTYSLANTTLARTEIFESSNANAAVTFVGAVNVFITYPSKKAVYLDATGNLSAAASLIKNVPSGDIVATNVQAAINELSSDSTVKANAAQSASTPIAHATDITNPHAVTKAQVGLSDADNTSDINKPVSTAQAAADALVAALNTSGTAQLNFGNGVKTSEVVVTGIPSVLTTSRVVATMRAEATSSHSVDDLQIDPIRVLVKSLVLGVGFTIYGEMDNAQANGLYNVDWFLAN